MRIPAADVNGIDDIAWHRRKRKLASHVAQGDAGTRPIGREGF
jgi:hypothetical protein